MFSSLWDRLSKKGSSSCGSEAIKKKRFGEIQSAFLAKL